MTLDDLKKESRVPVVFADQQGRITYVNAAFKGVFGWEAGEIVGKPLTLIIPKNLHDSHQLGFSRFLTTSKPTLLAQPLKLRAVTKDGKEFDAEHFIVAERQQARWVFGASITPVS